MKTGKKRTEMRKEMDEYRRIRAIFKIALS